MKSSTANILQTERRRSDFGFITEIAQRGRMRPKKYRHLLTMPIFLFEDLKTNYVINVEECIIDESAFFEFSENEMTISFINLFQCEDLHRKIDYYLVVKFAGSYPLKRSGIFF